MKSHLKSRACWMRKQSVGLVVSLAFAVGLSACSSPPKGYGVSTRNLPPAATMIADPAQADTTTTAEKTRDTYLDLIRQMQTQGSVSYTHLTLPTKA